MEEVDPSTFVKRSYPTVYYFKRLGFVAIAMLLRGDEMVGL
jgi:hypothetical protein